MPRKYILFDGRSCGLDAPDWHHLIIFSESKREALKDAECFGVCICYSYNYVNGEYLDERFGLITDSEYLDERFEFITDSEGKEIT